MRDGQNRRKEEKKRKYFDDELMILWWGSSDWQIVRPKSVLGLWCNKNTGYNIYGECTKIDKFKEEKIIFSKKGK